MKSLFCMAALILCSLVARAGEFQDAAAAGDLEKVRALIKANPTSVNARESGTTALHEAARAGHLEIVKLLVGSGANVNVRDISGLTPLKLAMGHRRLEVVEFLRRNGGVEQVVATAPATPGTPLPAVPVAPQQPAAQPQAPTVAAVPPQVPAVTPSNTAIPTADDTNLPPVAPMLTDRELLPGIYPIHELARVGDVEQIKMIYKTIPEIVDATDEKGFTALHVAAGNRQIAVARTLIGLRAKINARAFNGQTPLHSAARNGDVAMAALLITNRAEIDARDNLGQTPLLMVLQSASAVALAEAGASSDGGQRRGDMKEALARSRASVLSRNEEIVNLLLRSGADANVTDRTTRRSALHVAASLGHAPLVNALVRYRARVDALDTRGETPLAYALRQGHATVIAALRGAGGTVGQARTMSPTEQSLVDFYQQTEQSLQHASASEKARLLIALNPTEADCKRMFPKHAATAWKVVEQINRQIREAFARPLADAEQGKEIWRVSLEMPSAIVQDWRARGTLATDLPMFSLTVDKVGATTRPGDYCFVNGHWVMMPPLRNIAAQMAAVEGPRK
jgi:ankyrin repeat protein